MPDQPEKKGKLLITGASGFLGWNLCRIASKAWQVIGVFFRHPVAIQDVHPIKADLTDLKNFQKLFREIQPDAVIHAAAASRPDYCELHPSESGKINIHSSIHIAERCAALSIPFVFISSDLVFDGRNPPYSEKSPVNPINLYGEQKVRAEEKIFEAYPESIVCRLPLMFGYSKGENQSFTSGMIRSLKQGSRIRLFTDEFRTPVDAESAARGLLLSLENVKGIIHLGGHKRVSRYDMGVMLQKLLHVSPSLIQPISQKEVSMGAARPSDISLDSSRAFSMGYSPLKIEEGIRQMLQAMNAAR
ncbi:MAG: NAD(P)-dependent oxidoreductase [Desulfobacterales bacterium]